MFGLVSHNGRTLPHTLSHHAAPEFPRLMAMRQCLTMTISFPRAIHSPDFGYGRLPLPLARRTVPVRHGCSMASRLAVASAGTSSATPSSSPSSEPEPARPAASAPLLTASAAAKHALHILWAAVPFRIRELLKWLCVHILHVMHVFFILQLLWQLWETKVSRELF